MTQSGSSDSINNPLHHFTNRAEDYQKYRPIHPAAAIDTILAGLNSPEQLVAADIGAGTGIGSRLLAERGIQVIAIEPSVDMRTAAQLHAQVRFRDGTAEQIPLTTGTIDLVTVFQAFHWFEFDRSLQEFHRILKPGGRLALIWSVWDQQQPVSNQYTRLLHNASRHPIQISSSQSPDRSWLNHFRYQLFWWGVWLPNFTNLQLHKFTFTQTLDLAGLIGLAHSQGFTPSSGTALDALITELSKFHHRFCNTQGQVELAYRTRLYTAQRS
jgi:SAM-dependent methyltransferase